MQASLTMPLPWTTVGLEKHRYGEWRGQLRACLQRLAKNSCKTEKFISCFRLRFSRSPTVHYRDAMKNWTAEYGCTLSSNLVAGNSRILRY